MHIINAMFAKNGGGIEQAFVDYCEGLRNRGHRVTALVYPNSWAEGKLKALSIDTVAAKNWGEWDIFAAKKLSGIIKSLAADVVIAHANRAFSLCHRAIKHTVPVIGVAQNYSIRRYIKADAVFTTTHDLIHTLAAQGIDHSKIYHIPNMVHCNELPMRQPRRNPPIIGAMGRLVAKKGFDVYIEALSQLKSRGYKFKAVLGGSGAEEKKLRALAAERGVSDILEFIGWVDNRKAFYTGIDIFCLPSLHEPFGIVLLEAFTHGAPVISTKSEGPKDIITANHDALTVEIGNASELSTAMAKLLDNASLAEELAANAFAKVKTRYALEVVSEKIEVALGEILGSRF